MSDIPSWTGPVMAQVADSAAFTLTAGQLPKVSAVPGFNL
jgi:hypothetical protein